QNVASQIKYDAPKLPLVSNVTGEVMAAAPDKIYWRRHLREAVRFGDGMLALAELGCRTFIEIGPHPVLLPIAQACLGTRAKSAAWAATLNRQKADVDSMTETLAALYLAGQNINWNAVHSESVCRRVPLPTYPFERKRYWIEDNPIRSEGAKAIEQVHPLVGTRTCSAPNETCYEARYGVHRVGFFSDHKIGGAVVLPTAAELEAA